MKGYSKKIWIPQSLDERIQYHKQNRFNMNVFQIDFNILQNKAKVALGDPVFCQQCNVALSSLSKPNQIEKSNAWKWVCEFCQSENILENFEEEELPQEDDLCYIQKSNNQAKEQNKMEEESDISVIFCMDFSGSMNVTQELKNKNELKIDNKQLEELENFKQFMEPQEYQQYKQMVLQQQNKFISRKDCVLAAIKDQVQNLQKSYPNRKIGLVTFNDDVVVIGDGISGEEKVITGDKLQSYDQVYEEAKKYSKTHLNANIANSNEKLIEKFSQINPIGKTALGPALLTSLGLLEEAKPGSQIVICTDGLSNIGFGSLDNDIETEVSQVFYEKVGELAKEKGIQVSVITVKGEQCNIQTLGKLTEKTQGNITRVNPENIHNDFASILKEEVIATKVQLKVLLHNGLKFVNYEEDENVKVDEKEIYLREIGNVTQKTNVSFEYDLKTVEELQKKKIELKDLKKLPLQGQIQYISPEGHQMVRIITKFQEVAQEEQEVHKIADIDVIQKRQIHVNKKQAMKGNFQQVQQQQAQYSNFISNNNNNNWYDNNNQQQQMSLNNAVQKESQMNRLATKQMAKKCQKKKAVSSNNQQQQQQIQGGMGGMGGGLFGQSAQPPLQSIQQFNSMAPPQAPMLGSFGGQNLNNNNNNNNFQQQQMVPQQQQQQQQQQNLFANNNIIQEEASQMEGADLFGDEDEDDIDCDMLNFE